VFDALFDVKIDNLVRLAVEAPRVQEPGPAFGGFLLGVIEARATDRGLGVVVMRTGRGKRFATELGQRLAPIVERLISPARTAGEVREEFTGQDVCILSLMVGAVADNTRDIDPRPPHLASLCPDPHRWHKAHRHDRAALAGSPSDGSQPW